MIENPRRPNTTLLQVVRTTVSLCVFVGACAGAIFLWGFIWLADPEATFDNWGGVFLLLGAALGILAWPVAVLVFRRRPPGRAPL